MPGHYNQVHINPNNPIGGEGYEPPTNTGPANVSNPPGSGGFSSGFTEGESFNRLRYMRGKLGSALAMGIGQQAIAMDYAPSHIRASRAAGEEQRRQYGMLSDRLAASISTSRDRMRRTVGAQSAAAVQAGTAMPTTFSAAINDATRRSKARAGIMQRGEAAIENQALKDRLKFVRRGVLAKGRIETALSQAYAQREGLNTGLSDAAQQIAASNSALAGNIIGGVTGFLMDSQNREWLSGIFKPKQTPQNNPPRPGSGDGAPPT